MKNAAADRQWPVLPLFMIFRQLEQNIQKLLVNHGADLTKIIAVMLELWFSDFTDEQ